MKLIVLNIMLVIAFTPGYSQQYKRLHNKALLVDTHNDVLSAIVEKGFDLDNDLTGKAHSDLNRFRSGGVDAQIFSIWCDQTFGKDTAFKFANIEIDSLNALVTRNPGKMVFVRSPRQLNQAVKQKKLAALIGVEGGHMMEDNLLYLDSFYKRGVRYMTLTWNNSTSWASSAQDESGNTVTAASKGLNDFGKTVVKRMNDMGMMVDISHVGEQTFRDVIATTTKPVLASHSSVFSLCPHFRNLKDEQIKAIARNGGVIQLNFNSGFLDSTFMQRARAFEATHKPEIDSFLTLHTRSDIGSYLSGKYPEETNALRPPLSTLLDHIDYIVKLAGIDYVGLGSDFDGISSSPKGLEEVSCFPNVTKGLVERGYSKREIRKILGGNFMRVFKANVN